METLLSIVGSFLTAFSVLFAVYVYVRKRDSDTFAALRTSLVEMRMAGDLYKQAMAEAAFSEIGISISNQLRAVYPSGCTREDVIGLLTQPEMRNFTVTAIHLGLQESKSRKEARERSEKLIAIPKRYESTMPLISEVLGHCIIYVTQTLELIASNQFYVENTVERMGSDKDFSESMVNDLEKIENMDLLFRYLAELFFEISSAARTDAYIIASAATVIIDTFTMNVLKRSDAQLRRLRRRNQKIYRTSPVPVDTETSIDRAFFYLEEIKSEFSNHEWDIMLESKMTIDRVAHPADSS